MSSKDAGFFLTRIAVSGFLAILVMLALGPRPLAAQTTYIYVNDDPSGANTVTAFSVGAGGSLVPVPGSPFATGGTGCGVGFFAANRVATSIVGNFLYAANCASGDISGFSITPATGVLTPVPGSPFPAPPVSNGISLAATPNGQYLIAANNLNPTIHVFSIAGTGALAPVAGSPFASPDFNDGIKVSPNGQFLAVAGAGAIYVYSISPAGALAPVPGSPFDAENAVASADINCNNDRLFAGVANLDGFTIVDVFTMSPAGALAPIAGSPFQPGGGSNSNVALLSPNDQLLFVSNQFSASITVFTVAPSGALALVGGSPFPAPGAFTPSGMATDPAGSYLYAAGGNTAVYGYSVAGGGALAPVPGSPFPTAPGGVPLSVTAYPPKACTIAAAIDVKFCSDPNGYNCRAKGVLPVTIFGTAGLNVANIDISSLRLCLASSPTTCTSDGPRSWSVADRGDPTVDIGANSCTVINGVQQNYRTPDGLADLDVAFDNQQVATLIGCGGLSKKNASPTLILTGQMNNGQDLESIPVNDVGVDQLLIQNK